MNPAPVPPYEMTVRVNPADIDALGHVNNIVYLRYAQDIAWRHSEALGFDQGW